MRIIPPAIMATEPTISLSPFGKTKSGMPVTLFTLDNGRGLRADVMDYGATVVRLFAPDRKGRAADVALGFNTLREYEKSSPFFGCVVGRFANRIAGGRYKIGSKTYEAAINNDPNSLHGGNVGFDKAVWDAKPLIRDGQPGIRFSHTSPDGDEGYPGNLEVVMYYWLTKKNGLVIDYRARTDKTTIVNLTNHSYFNLKGEGKGDILDHMLKLNARAMTPVDENLIPTGEIAPVKGTPFDFTRPQAIGERVNADDEQLARANGYDHNFVINSEEGSFAKAAEVTEPKSGRVMEVFTTEPGVQLYIGNFLDGPAGKSGKPYNFRHGFCLECQHFPDSPNQKNFPSTLLRKGEIYSQVTEYRFKAK